MRFSIIVPVYNVERYIDKCMDTLTHQTFEDYEIIVVNDETPDNSMEIVRKYEETFPDKIQVIHQKNTRQGGARNNGVTKARGEYILFVDSDDYVALNMLEVVDQRLREKPCDILVFRNIPVSEEGMALQVAECPALPTGYYIPTRDIGVVLLSTGPTNKAFRREFYQTTQVQFPEKLLYEDSITRLFYAMASSLTVCDDVLYYYVQSSESTIRQKISDKMLDILTMTDLVLEQFREKELYETFKEPLNAALIYGILYILDRVNNFDWNHPLQKEMADFISSRFADYKTNPYVSDELCRALDCLTAHAFWKYHYRFLLLNRFKEWLLQCKLVAELNAWRKHR